MSLASPEDDMLIIGDFNLPNIKWSPAHGVFLYPDPARSSFSVPSEIILDSLSTATLRQINSVENENGRMLDLCFVNEGISMPTIELAPAPLVKLVRHHPALLISIEVSGSVFSSEKPAAFFHDYKNADFHAISVVLDSIDWESELVLSDPNAAAETFSHIINYIIDRHVPKRLITGNFRAPWITKELRQMKTLKCKAFRNYNRNKSQRTKDHYRILNSAYKKASSRCYKNYLTRLQRNFKKNPKSFWKHVKDQRRETGLPTRMFLDDEMGNSDADICNLLAKKFSSVFTSGPISADQITNAARNVPSLNSSLNNIVIEEETILKATAKMKNSLSSGPDGIPATFLKRFMIHLLFPIKRIFQASLDRAVFPSLWKDAYMFPVHKKGDKRDVNNYRGISALCAIAKLFELVILDPIFYFSKQYFSNDQHGFMPKRSTSTNLLTFTSFVQDSFTAGIQTDAIYTDLSAAFDKVNHEIAIAKLGRLGICGSLLDWFRSYLTGRKLTVKSADSLSRQFPATSGVPQGSHLGPIIFLIYFNDALLLLDGPKLAYADDLKLFNAIKGPEDTVSLQRQFNLFATWCNNNCLALNRSKCSIITFSRKRHPILADYFLSDHLIARVDHIKDLGVVLDQKLDFKTHTNYIVDKASRCLGFIFRVTKDYRDVYCLKSLYCSLVRSILEYASAVWCPFYQNGADRIEALQRRFMRYALRHLNWSDPFHLPSYENRCNLISLDTLQARRAATRALLISDILASRIDCPSLLESVNLSVRPQGLRNRNLLLYTPLRQNNYGANSALIGVIRTFNRFSEHFEFDASRDLFRRKILITFRTV